METLIIPPNLVLVHLLAYRGLFDYHFQTYQSSSFNWNSFCLSFSVKDLGIVQCFVFLGFLSLLENFGLATLIPFGIRVLGVETPLRT